MLSWLREQNVEHRSYYIVNMIWVKGSRDVALALAARPDVARLEGKHNDQVLYQKARAYDELGRTEEAMETMER